MAREPADGDRHHGAEVDTHHVAHLLERTGRLRLAVCVLWRDLPQELRTEAIDEALSLIHERLLEAEMEDLRRFGETEQHVIVLPINPLRMPGSPDMAKVAEAIRVLDDLGLIVRPDYV
jgi:hypothetical protein